MAFRISIQGWCRVSRKGKTQLFWCFLKVLAWRSHSITQHSWVLGSSELSWDQIYCIPLKSSSQWYWSKIWETAQGGREFPSLEIPKILGQGPEQPHAISKLALYWAGYQTWWFPRVHPNLCKSVTRVLQMLELQRNLRGVWGRNYTEGVSPDSSGIALYTKMKQSTPEKGFSIYWCASCYKDIKILFITSISSVFITEQLSVNNSLFNLLYLGAIIDELKKFKRLKNFIHNRISVSFRKNLTVAVLLSQNSLINTVLDSFIKISLFALSMERMFFAYDKTGLCCSSEGVIFPLLKGGHIMT